MIFIDYQLPGIEFIENIKERKFLKNRNEYDVIRFSKKEFEELYEKALYSIVIRTIMEIFHHDSGNFIDALIFNGRIWSINKATGNEMNNCILSIQVSKSDFTYINPLKIDVKACFKFLKGVSSSKLATYTSIQPVATIDKNDRRFVENQYINIDDTTNLAAMHWEDFEHLIRELFEKEFTINGGEVRVTQASRDGGVDAIAFDPDPIRGGKIVIQAKRYTNIVGVSAVRDLYGTVLNEGANKGILVTTSDYGSDSYGFAKGKPITLLNGSNLLYLLEKHGRRARIDILEAKLKNV